MDNLRNFFSCLVGLLPASTGKNRLLSLLGHKTHKSARVGSILLLGSQLEVASGGKIGSFSVFLRTSVTVGSRARIGSFVWIASSPELAVSAESTETTEPARLLVGGHAAIMSRHYLDASGGISFGPFSTLAGGRSALYTHGIDIDRNVMKVAPIIVGSYSMVGSNVCFAPGATVPPRSVVAMGSVVLPGLVEELRLYAGTPAVQKKLLSEHARYFSRTSDPLPEYRIE